VALAAVYASQARGDETYDTTLAQRLRDSSASEDLRQAITANKAEIDNALRVAAAEANYDREERSNALRRIEHAVSDLALMAADVAQVQSQASQLNQVMQTLLERQREVEGRAEQFGLRLERAIEVNRDLEQRIRDSVVAAQEERFDLVFERLQLVGEMVRWLVLVPAPSQVFVLVVMYFDLVDSWVTLADYILIVSCTGCRFLKHTIKELKSCNPQK